VSTTFLDSVFGPLESPSNGNSHPPISDIANRQHPHPAQETAVQAAEVRWANSELLTIANTIEELQGRLDETNARMASAATIETTEVEIGRLFVEAQRFSEDSMSKLELAILEILGEAQAKARQILAEATEEAREIRRQAQLTTFASTGTTKELQGAIAGFTTVNSELLKELSALNTIMTRSGDRG
jgi:cell division septum initiation protein DivIVA